MGECLFDLVQTSTLPLNEGDILHLKHLEFIRLRLGHYPHSNQHDHSGECLPDSSNFNTPSQLGRHFASCQDS